MVLANIDPLRLQRILNKTPGKTVTAEEWNEILNLLVTQGNYLSESYKSMYDTIQDILNGSIEGIEIQANVNSFGGRPPEDYALKIDLESSSDTMKEYVDLKLKNKQNTIKLTANRAVFTSPTGELWPANVTGPELSYLSGVKKPLQGQLDSKLDTTARASDTGKVVGKVFFIQQSQPNATQVGDVWIGW